MLSASQQSRLSVFSGVLASNLPIEKDFLLVGRLEMMGVEGGHNSLVSNV